jgi:hypothetical protein
MTSELKLDEGSDAVVVQGGIKATFNASGITVNVQGATITIDKSGTVAMQTAANDTAAKAAHEIGTIESGGKHKGEIYGGIFPDGKPGWISEELEPLTHYEASELKGCSLPTSKEGKYIDTIKDKGALKDIFARHSGSSSSAGYFWLAEHNDFYGGRCQQFSDGSQDHGKSRDTHLPVLSVRR